MAAGRLDRGGLTPGYPPPGGVRVHARSYRPPNGRRGAAGRTTKGAPNHATASLIAASLQMPDRHLGLTRRRDGRPDCRGRRRSRRTRPALTPAGNEPAKGACKRLVADAGGRRGRAVQGVSDAAEATRICRSRDRLGSNRASLPRGRLRPDTRGPSVSERPAQPEICPAAGMYPGAGIGPAPAG